MNLRKTGNFTSNVKIKLHTYNQSMCSRRNHKGSQKILKYENKNTTYQKLQDAAKTVLRGKFIVYLKAYIKREDIKSTN